MIQTKAYNASRGWVKCRVHIIVLYLWQFNIVTTIKAPITQRKYTNCVWKAPVQSIDICWRTLVIKDCHEDQWTQLTGWLEICWKIKGSFRLWNNITKYTYFKFTVHYFKNIEFCKTGNWDYWVRRSLIRKVFKMPRSPHVGESKKHIRDTTNMWKGGDFF